MSKHLRPNATLERAGWVAQHQTALLVTLLLDKIRREVDGLHDGWPTKGGDQVRVSGAGARVRVEQDEHGPAEDVPVTGVERAAMARFRAGTLKEELRDRLDGVVVSLTELDRWLRLHLGNDLPRHIPSLCDGKAKGYEGVALAWVPHSREPDNGWHDPTCRDAAGPTGLCDACLVRMERWRRRQGLAPVSTQPAA